MGQLRPAGQAPGIVKVRLSGSLEDVADLARVIDDAAAIEGFEIIERSDPYPNRRNPGQRVYLTVRFPGRERGAVKMGED